MIGLKEGWQRAAAANRLVDAAPTMLRVLKLTRAAIEQLPEDVRMTAFRVCGADGELGQSLDLNALLEVYIDAAITKATNT